MTVPLCAVAPASAQHALRSSVLPDLNADAASVANVDWQAVADSVLGQAVADGKIPGATVVVVSREEIIFEASVGVANLESQEAVTDSTLFEVGSVGKVLTAIAVLQQVERRLLDLDTDVNEYLAEWKVRSGGESPITLHHLLTHTAGLNDRAIGYAVTDAEVVQPLGEHLAAHFPTPFASPGQYVSYSNYGFGLAGYLVETVSRRPFSEYVSDEILAPLGAAESGYKASMHVPNARGYRRHADGFEAAPDFHRPVTPAGSFVASSREMALLLRALLNDGTPILSRESTVMMTSIRSTQHELLMGSTYGLEESRWGRIRGFGKGGSIPGFTAYMAVIPENGIGVFVAANSSSDDAIDRFVTTAFGGSAAQTSDFAAISGVDVSLLAGEYRSNRYDRTSIEKLLRMEIHNIYEYEDGSLGLWHDGAMNHYRPIDDLVLQNTDDSNRFLVFEKHEDGSVTNAFFNERFAGGYVPVVWERNGFWNSNTYVNEYFGVVGLVALSYLLFPVLLVVGAVRRRLKPGAPRSSGSRRWLHATGFLTSAVLLAYVLLYFIPLLKVRSELVFGMPADLAPWSVLPWVTIAGFAMFSGLWLRALHREGGRPRLVFGLVFILSGVLVLEFFLRWNLL